MGDKLSFIPLYERSPLFQLIISLLIVLCGGMLIFSGLITAGSVIFHTDPDLIKDPSYAAANNEVAFLKFALISQDISIFIIPSLIILFLLKPRYEARISCFKTPALEEVFLVILLSFSIFPISIFAGQINSGLHLPGWLSGLEKWMIDKDENVSQMLGVMIVPGDFIVIILNVLIVALLPAIGEELIFRGVLQKIGYKLFRSQHLSVWVTAFVFSAIHLQFLGLLPRFILGLVFGYLFLWSGNLLLPMLAHFVNNAVPTIGASVRATDKINLSADNLISNQLILLVFPLLLSFIILLYFRNKSRE